MAMRVPTGSISVDGLFSDWQRAGEALSRYRVVSDREGLWLPADPDLGTSGGPADSSLTAYLAVDADALYLYADVHDQVLVNSSDDKAPYTGDDFEVFVSAGPEEARFGDTKTVDYRQFVFLPAFVNTAYKNTIIWQANELPGVQAASRLQPWGYSIEVRIPRALFPYWAAHPAQTSIGFDCQINDADAPGIDCHHPSVKGARQLLSSGRHFQSPALMGQLDLDPAATPMQPGTPPRKVLTTRRLCAALKSVQPNAAEGLAAEVLAHIAARDARQVATAAVQSSDEIVQRAGALILAQRPDLPAPYTRLRQLLAPDPQQGPIFTHPALRAYVMRALAERGKLPVDPEYASYLTAQDIPLHLTWVWCLGRNGDLRATPALCTALHDPNVRVRMQAGLACSLLRDPACLPALRDVEQHDADVYVRKQATLAIAAY